MDTQLINIIFGMKIRQARIEANLTLAELAAQCDLSPSYMTEVEKGRKYPRADKIIKMAAALHKSYDEMVSITLAPSLADLEATLASPVLRQLPFEEFGVSTGDLVDLLTRVPDKASAFLHAILDVGHQFDLKGENFVRAMLRSYQEMHNNHFPEIEEAAAQFAQQYEFSKELPIRLDALEGIIRDYLGIEIDMHQLDPTGLLGGYRSIFVKGAQPKLLLNPALPPTQRRFCIARELGYLVLGLTERAYTSSPDEVRSFTQVLNDFKASYFASALLMPRDSMLADIEDFFAQPTWRPERLLAMLTKYEATPEVLIYRFTELIPQYFGLKLHSLRVQEGGPRFEDDTKDRYKLVKQLNMNRLLLPSGLALDEHYCRRWLVIQLLRELRVQKAPEPLVVGAQLSEFLESRDRFLCFGFAYPLALQSNINSSIIVGFRMEPGLQQIMRFATDPTIPFVTVNETCERCSLTSEQCGLRSTPPTILQTQEQVTQRKQALNQLIAQLQGVGE